MPLATVRSCALAGVAATPVVVEVHLGGGLPGMTIVGLPQSAVKESKDRVKAAIRHAGFGFPRVKVIVNLAPADLPKRGGRFDLPIALGILIASEQLSPTARGETIVVGELGLGGGAASGGGRAADGAGLSRERGGAPAAVGEPGRGDVLAGRAGARRDHARGGLRRAVGDGRTTTRRGGGVAVENEGVAARRYGSRRRPCGGAGRARAAFDGEARGGIGAGGWSRRRGRRHAEARPGDTLPSWQARFGRLV